MMNMKRCACGAAYTREIWDELPLVGYQSSGLHEHEAAGLELRNCRCGSTMSLAIDLRTALRASRDRDSSEKVRASALSLLNEYADAPLPSDISETR